MAKVMVMMNNGTTKRMEKRFARALVHCKKAIIVDDYEKKVITPAMMENKYVPPVEQTKDELSETRAEYQEKFNKKPFHGWSVEELKAKIAEAE